ncbi:MAG: hypothetical protein VB066_01795 [Paludibacter sp.]|nr:hypothetical protein [Paludibacter sp.]
MARTLNEILLATRQAWIDNLVLRVAYELNPAIAWDEQFSATSVESQITYIISYVIWIFEMIVSDITNQITSQIAAQQPFSVPWYTDVAKRFQIGDQLLYDENTYKFDYAVIDNSKQIVKYVAIRQRQIEGVTKLQVFATKANKVAMTADELQAFSSYITQKGAAGTHFQFISLAPDELVINLTVYYNPQIIGADGLLLSGGSNPVEIAVNTYLNSIQYAGVFNRTKLTDSVQNADGVNDVILGDVRLNGDLNNSRQFESASGFYSATTINVTYHAD